MDYVTPNDIKEALARKIAGILGEIQAMSEKHNLIPYMLLPEGMQLPEIFKGHIEATHDLQGVIEQMPNDSILSVFVHPGEYTIKEPIIISGNKKVFISGSKMRKNSSSFKF